MKVFRQILNHIRHAAGSKLVVGALFVALSAIALGGSLFTSGVPASAQTCRANDILPCGAQSVSDFVAKYKQNNVGDLDNVYAHYGLAADEVDRFSRTAKMGTALKNGDIVVDGKVIATDATSLGRERKPYSTPIVINGKTYHSSRSQDVFLSNSIPAMVMMNGEQFEFAALTECGNPITGKPKGKPPVYSCDMLHTKQINRTTYSYTTDTTALNGAKVAKLVYDFGDGKTQTAASGSQAVTHTYAKEGNYTTKVTVYVTVNGETKPVTSAKCAKPVEVKAAPPKPAYACDALTVTTINQQNRQYRFSAKTSQSGGAVLKDASFNFGDNVTVNNVKPADANTVNTEHAYAQAGTYTIVATVNFSVAGGVKSVTCQAKISPEQQPPAECKPGIPVGDARCAEMPTSLPDTGAANVLGGAIGATSLLGAGSYLLRSRRNLLKTFLNQ